MLFAYIEWSSSHINKPANCREYKCRTNKKNSKNLYNVFIKCHFYLLQLFSDANEIISFTQKHSPKCISAFFIQFVMAHRCAYDAISHKEPEHLQKLGACPHSLHDSVLFSTGCPQPNFGRVSSSWAGFRPGNSNLNCKVPDFLVPQAE